MACTQSKAILLCSNKVKESEFRLPLQYVNRLKRTKARYTKKNVTLFVPCPLQRETKESLVVLALSPQIDMYFPNESEYSNPVINQSRLHSIEKELLTGTLKRLPVCTPSV